MVDKKKLVSVEFTNLLEYTIKYGNAKRGDAFSFVPTNVYILHYADGTHDCKRADDMSDKGKEANEICNSFGVTFGGF